MPADAPIVSIAPGRVRGFWQGEGGERRTAAFRGIPFAKAPTGARRYAAPEPPDPWDGVRDALEFGPTAQRGDPGVTLIPEPSVPGKATLNVNVYTPAPGDPEARLPVMVWIHGGGYVAGAPASPWYDGRTFARDGVVLVVISYRLGFDGFGWIDGAPSNRGVRDWLAALEWVQENIAAFGGDPADVTIAGQSAGGGAVLTLLGMPQAQHLFRQAISISGALADIPEDRARATAARLAENLGVAPTRDGFASLRERTISHIQVPSAQDTGVKGIAALRSALVNTVPYGPVIDGDLLTRPTVDSLAAGVGADKPLLLGSTDDEFAMITEPYRRRLAAVPASLALRVLQPALAGPRAYRRANRDVRGTAAMLGRFVSDRVFRTLVVRVARAREAAAAPTWAYRFSWRSPTRGIALHCLDVPFWFDCLGAEGVAAVAGDNPPPALADALHGSAVAFVREGDPGWAPWSERPGTARVFGGPASSPDVLPDAYASVRALV